MASNRKHKGRRPSRQVGYNKVRARTERMNSSVRLAMCVLALTACLAFMAAALQPYRELKKMQVDLAEVQQLEFTVIERKDAKEREHRAIQDDPRYLELIARDRLNYYKPGEHIFRVQNQ